MFTMAWSIQCKLRACVNKEASGVDFPKVKQVDIYIIYIYIQALFRSGTIDTRRPRLSSLLDINNKYQTKCHSPRYLDSMSTGGVIPKDSLVLVTGANGLPAQELSALL